MTNLLDFDSIELMDIVQATFDHLARKKPMSETRKGVLRFDLDRRLKLEFHGTEVTHDAKLPAYREFDEALDLTLARPSSPKHHFYSYCSQCSHKQKIIVNSACRKIGKMNIEKCLTIRKVGDTNDEEIVQKVLVNI